MREKTLSMIVLSAAAILLAGCVRNTILDYTPFKYPNVERTAIPIDLRVGFEGFEDKRYEGGSEIEKASAAMNRRFRVSFSQHKSGYVWSSDFSQTPLSGPLDENLTNELYYHFLNSGIFSDISRWHDEGEVDLLIRGEIYAFASLKKTVPTVAYVYSYSIPFFFGCPTGYKKEDVHLKINLIDPRTGLEIASYDLDKKVKRYLGWYYPRKNLASKVVRDAFAEVFQAIQKDRGKILDALKKPSYIQVKTDKTPLQERQSVENEVSIATDTTPRSIESDAIVTERTIVHEGPGYNYGFWIHISKGARIKILEEKNGWYRISSEEDVSGWIPKDRGKILHALKKPVCIEGEGGTSGGDDPNHSPGQ